MQIEPLLEPFDVRPYLLLLRRNGRKLALFALATAVTALIVSLILPPTYEATALVAVTQPRQLVQFDPRFEAVQDDVQSLLAYPELALSDQIFFDLLTKTSLPDIETIEDLHDMLEAVPANDPGLIRLTVSYDEPETAAQIANNWADLFITQMNTLYGDQGGAQVRFFQEQLVEAEQVLNEAEATLVEFQLVNEGNLINDELHIQQSAHAQYLADLNQITFLRHDIQALHTQMSTTVGGIAFSDQLTALFLQIKVFNAETGIPLEVQIDTDNTITHQNHEEQIAFLNDLLLALDNRVIEDEARLAELRPQILTLQQSYQGYVAHYNGLLRDITVAEETYTALARKVNEEQITAQDTSMGVRLASLAYAPQEPTRPLIILNTLLGGALGLFLATFTLLITVWYRQTIIQPTDD
jgi:uncharacterized protein involved in exopolysaccharide biosynthesis